MCIRARRLRGTSTAAAGADQGKTTYIFYFSSRIITMTTIRNHEHKYSKTNTDRHPNNHSINNHKAWRYKRTRRGSRNKTVLKVKAREEKWPNRFHEPASTAERDGCPFLSPSLRQGALRAGKYPARHPDTLESIFSSVSRLSDERDGCLVFRRLIYGFPSEFGAMRHNDEGEIILNTSRHVTPHVI